MCGRRSKFAQHKRDGIQKVNIVKIASKLLASEQLAVHDTPDGTLAAATLLSATGNLARLPDVKGLVGAELCNALCINLRIHKAGQDHNCYETASKHPWVTVLEYTTRHRVYFLALVRRDKGGFAPQIDTQHLDSGHVLAGYLSSTFPSINAWDVFEHGSKTQHRQWSEKAKKAENNPRKMSAKGMKRGKGTTEEASSRRDTSTPQVSAHSYTSK